jgi:hypothetical protein
VLFQHTAEVNPSDTVQGPGRRFNVGVIEQPERLHGRNATEAADTDVRVFENYASLLEGKILYRGKILLLM